MILSLSRNEICEYYSQQLNNFFPDNTKVSKSDLERIIDLALDRLNFCFKNVAFERYFKDGQTLFDHLYSDHNIVMIWFLANSAFKAIEDERLAAKLYYLNKSLHAFDCMFNTELPDIFLIFHGAGTMLGKARYENYFVCLQGCTVGSHNGRYPNFSKGVALAANAGIVGNCTVGAGASISAFTRVFEYDIPERSVAFTNSNGVLEVKRSKKMYAQQFFNVDVLA